MIIINILWWFTVEVWAFLLKSCNLNWFLFITLVPPNLKIPLQHTLHVYDYEGLNAHYCSCRSIHTVVCHIVQESGVPHHDYIDRKNNNIKLRAASIKPHNFCSGIDLHHQYPTFQISIRLDWAFLRYELPRIGLVSLFFPIIFLLFIKVWKLPYSATYHPIVLQFETQKGGGRVLLGTNFGWNMVNTYKVICNCSQKPPICYHAHG